MSDGVIVSVRLGPGEIATVDRVLEGLRAALPAGVAVGRSAAVRAILASVDLAAVLKPSAQPAGAGAVTEPLSQRAEVEHG